MLWIAYRVLGTLMPTAVKPPALCIFDLDGTLVDSLRDIAEALNACLRLLGLPGRPVEEYRYMVGEGVPKLCERAIGGSHPHLVARLAELARARYRIRVHEHTRPYRGVDGLVRQLSERGVKLAVLSNKPHELTVRVTERFWPNGRFEVIQGYVEEDLRKPDPHYIYEICRRAGVDPAADPAGVCLVGDTPTDIETARRAGIAGIGVTWGFRTRSDLTEAGAETIVDSPEELASMLGLPESL